MDVVVVIVVVVQPTEYPEFDKVVCPLHLAFHTLTTSSWSALEIQTQLLCCFRVVIARYTMAQPAFELSTGNRDLVCVEIDVLINQSTECRSF